MPISTGAGSVRPRAPRFRELTAQQVVYRVILQTEAEAIKALGEVFGVVPPTAAQSKRARTILRAFKKAVSV